jgi:hypothetical protein
MSAQLAGFVDAVAELVEAHGPDERSWFAAWCADFEEAGREGDDAAATLLLDALVAFNAWLGGKHSVGARRP